MGQFRQCWCGWQTVGSAPGENRSYNVAKQGELVVRWLPFPMQTKFRLTWESSQNKYHPAEP